MKAHTCYDIRDRTVLLCLFSKVFAGLFFKPVRVAVSALMPVTVFAPAAVFIMPVFARLTKRKSSSISHYNP